MGNFSFAPGLNIFPQNTKYDLSFYEAIQLGSSRNKLILHWKGKETLHQETIAVDLLKYFEN